MSTLRRRATQADFKRRKALYIFNLGELQQRGAPAVLVSLADKTHNAEYLHCGNDLTKSLPKTSLFVSSIVLAR